MNGIEDVLLISIRYRKICFCYCTHKHRLPQLIHIIRYSITIDQSKQNIQKHTQFSFHRKEKSLGINKNKTKIENGFYGYRSPRTKQYPRVYNDFSRTLKPSLELFNNEL